MKKAVIFGSSAPVEGDEDYQEAYEIGKLLGEMGFAVVNGGYMGIMEASSKGAKDAKAKTIGITSKVLTYATPNKWLDEEVTSEDLFDRIKKNIAIGDVFIVLKGSTGTMHEFMALWDLMSLKMVEKRPIICYGNHWKEIVEKIAGVPKYRAVDAHGPSSLVKFAETKEELKEILKEIKPIQQP